MEEQTQYRGASLVVVGGGVLVCLLDWLFAASNGSPNVVAPFGILGFVSIVGGSIAFWRSRPR